MPHMDARARLVSAFIQRAVLTRTQEVSVLLYLIDATDPRPPSLELLPVEADSRLLADFIVRRLCPS